MDMMNIPGFGFFRKNVVGEIRMFLYFRPSYVLRFDNMPKFSSPIFVKLQDTKLQYKISNGLILDFS